MSFYLPLGDQIHLTSNNQVGHYTVQLVDEKGNPYEQDAQGKQQSFTGSVAAATRKIRLNRRNVSVRPIKDFRIVTKKQYEEIVMNKFKEENSFIQFPTIKAKPKKQVFGRRPKTQMSTTGLAERGKQPLRSKSVMNDFEPSTMKSSVYGPPLEEVQKTNDYATLPAQLKAQVKSLSKPTSYGWDVSDSLETGPYHIGSLLGQSVMQRESGLKDSLTKGISKEINESKIGSQEILSPERIASPNAKGNSELRYKKEFTSPSRKGSRLESQYSLTRNNTHEKDKELKQEFDLARDVRVNLALNRMTLKQVNSIPLKAKKSTNFDRDTPLQRKGSII